MIPMKPSTPASKGMQRIKRSARGMLYWGLPPLILFVIFRQIDMAQLGQLVSNADMLLVLLGIAMPAPVVVLGALRWHFLMRRYQCASVPLSMSISEYWKSVAVGLLTPGSIGSDAYRVMVLGRREGFYLRCAFVIGVEKLAALIACATLVAALYPLLPSNHLPSMMAQAVDAIYLIFLAGLALTISVLLVRRQDWARRLAQAFDTQVEAMARRVIQLSPGRFARTDGEISTGTAMLLSLFRPAVALPALGFSLAIYLVTSAQSQVFFLAFGYDIPYSINLFVTPLLFLLYALPISFGGIGIREGAFILAYGAFGVPAETSLVISFSGLLASLISYGVGAGLFMLDKPCLPAVNVPAREPPPAVSDSSSGRPGV